MFIREAATSYRRLTEPVQSLTNRHGNSTRHPRHIEVSSSVDLARDEALPPEVEAGLSPMGTGALSTPNGTLVSSSRKAPWPGPLGGGESSSVRLP